MIPYISFHPYIAVPEGRRNMAKSAEERHSIVGLGDLGQHQPMSYKQEF